MTPTTVLSAPATTIIATRESRLALWQAEHVRDLLATRFGLKVELLGMTTRGDEILNVTLSKVGGKGLFVKELETALEEGRAHLAVHSLKDVPMDLPPGFALAAVLQREDPRDAWVSNAYASLAELPQGAKVGTSSLRRVVQLRALRPDLLIEPVRGNLDTRLRKLDEGQYDAIVLAAAGLKRLGLAARIRSVFEPEQMLPCAGQGALGLEVRADAHALLEQLGGLSHTATELAVHAERAVSRALGGSCSMPLAAYATFDAPATSDARASGGVLALRVALGHPEQTERPLLRASASAPVATEADARALGEKAAGLLREAGAAALPRRRFQRQRLSTATQGMRVIVTRPAEQARQWVDALQQRGLDAVALPLIDIAAPADPDAVLRAWQALAAQRLAVFVSPNAVEHFFKLRPAAAPWPAGVLAASPGPGTTLALRRAGVPAEAIVEPAADAAQFDSEALWQRLREHDWAGAQVLVLRGDGGREWLADTLTAHGAEVAFVAAYRRAAPRFDVAQQAVLAQALAEPAAQRWLFSSSEAIDHLGALRPGADWSAAHAVASHPRIVKRARAAGFGRVDACRPAVADVVACLQSCAS